MLDIFHILYEFRERPREKISALLGVLLFFFFAVAIIAGAILAADYFLFDRQLYLILAG